MHEFSLYKIYLYGILLLIPSYLQPTSQCVAAVGAFNADLLKDMAEYYHARCIIVVRSDSEYLSASHNILTMGKSLDAQFLIAMRLDDFEIMADSFHCRQNRPLYVLSDDNETRNYLERTTLVASHPRWIMFLSEHSTAYDALGQVNIPFDCEFLSAKWTGGSAELSLVYKVHDSGPLMVESFSLWVPNVGLKVWDTESSLYARRRDFQGLKLKALAGNGSAPAMIIEYPPEDDGPVDIGGFIGNIWKLLEELLNFRSEYTASGASASVMIKLVASKQSHCVLTDVTMVGSRLDNGQFLMTLITSKLSLIIRKPDEVSVEWDVLLAPFNKYLWATFLISLLVVGFSLAFVQNTTKRHCKNDKMIMDRYDNSFLLVLGLFCHQGCDMSFRPTSARTLMITVSLMSLVFMAAYSGILISFLAHQKLLFPFQSLQGLADDGTYKLGTLQGAATLEMFHNATSPLYKHMYDSFFYHDGTGLPLYAGKDLPLICTERIAFLATREYKEKNDRAINYACKIAWLDETIRPLSSSIIVSKTSPYRGAFNHWLHRLRDTGTLNHLRLTTWPAGRKFADAPPEFTSLTFTHVAPILSMLASGVVAALGILLAEMAVSRWQRRGPGGDR